MKKLLLPCLSVLLAGIAAPALAAGPAHGATYVAMGSSFASGLGVATRVPGSPPGCARSTADYAHVLARKRGLHLVDMTCAGATTADILDRSQAGQPPEIDAVDADTRLVTITIGGNDLAYIGNLWAESCLRRPDAVPAAWHPQDCKVVPEDQVQAASRRLPMQFHRIITQIRARAPHAEIVLVDYTNILPSHGSCPQRLPLSPEQIAAGRRVAAQLARITAEAAKADHVKLVAASAVTMAHDVCAADPWVSGFRFPPNPRVFAPVPYHPTGQAMAAIAAAVDRAL